MEAYAPQKIRVFQGKSGKRGENHRLLQAIYAKSSGHCSSILSFFNLRIARFFKVDLEALGQIILADLKLRF